MRFINFKSASGTGLAVRTGEGVFRGLDHHSPKFPGTLKHLLASGARAMQEAAVTLGQGSEINIEQIEFLPPLPDPEKIICIGLNYADHSAESGFKQPAYPTVFARFATSLLGHGAAIIRPRVSEQLDYEGELVAIIGKGGRNISKETALDHAAGT